MWGICFGEEKGKEQHIAKKKEKKIVAAHSRDTTLIQPSFQKK